MKHTTIKCDSCFIELSDNYIFLEENLRTSPRQSLLGKQYQFCNVKCLTKYVNRPSQSRESAERGE